MKTRIMTMVMAAVLGAGLLLWQAPVSAEEPGDQAPKAEGKDKAKAKTKAKDKAAKKASKKTEEDKGAQPAPEEQE